MPQSPKAAEVTYVTIAADKQNQRIDNYLSTFLKGVPKSRIYRLLRKGEVRVNKKRVKPSYRLQANDYIRIPPVRRAQPRVAPEPSKQLEQLLKSRIIYEDDDLLILNKPSGLPVHGGSGLKGGVIEAMRHIFPQHSSLELVHRLDKETSGCLIITKKNSVLRRLHELLREGKIIKIYELLVLGHWPKKQTEVNIPLKKNELDSGERMVKVTEDGREARTLFKPIQYFANETLLEATLITGRTHQIRVHTAHLGHPIAADSKYGDKAFNQRVKTKGLKRLFLHAKSLQLPSPSSGEVINVCTPLDEDLQKCLHLLS